MNTLENYRNEEFVAFCSAQLREYMQDYRGIESVLLATPDGFDIASIDAGRRANDNSADKLAAVGSSLFALGTSLISECNLKECRSIILDSKKGKIFISSISDMQSSIILMVQTNEQATLGNIIHGAKALNDSIGAKLSRIAKKH